MARIEGVNLPGKKRVEYGLTYLYGIGPKSSRDILSKVGVSLDKRVKDLTDQEVANLQKEITAHYRIEGELRKDVLLNSKRLQ